MKFTLPREIQSGNALAYRHWRVRQRLKQAQRRLQGASGCISSTYCGTVGPASLCDRCAEEVRQRLAALSDRARLDPLSLSLLLLVEGFERAEQEIYGAA